MEKCASCGKIITNGVWVKVKGQRALRWYCKDCTKGGGKDVNPGKGN